MSTTLSACRTSANTDENLPMGALAGRYEHSQGAFDGDLRSLRQFALRIRFSRNETIFNEGDVSAHVFKIITGTIRLCKHTQDGRRQITDFMYPGDVFGIWEHDEYGFTAEAVTDAILLAYPRQRIEHLWSSGSEQVKRGFAFLTDHLMNMQKHIVVLGCQSAKERVASFLLRLSERNGATDGERIDLPMGRQDIANHLGLSIETVCRVITDLRRDGLVKMPNLHQLILSNMPVLRALSSGEHSC